MTTLLELANRFRTFTFDKPEPVSQTVWYSDNSSVGNRYRSWKSIVAKRSPADDDNVIDMERLYNESSGKPCDWSYLFDQIHYGLIVGPKTLAAVEECLELLRSDEPPEDDGTKVRHVNRLGGVNYVSKPTYHDWDLTSRIANILSAAFFEDRNDKKLYSEDFVYIYNSHSGWNRAS